MNALRYLVPAMLTIQFLLVLASVASAMLFPEPQFSVASRKSVRPRG